MRHTAPTAPPLRAPLAPSVAPLPWPRFAAEVGELYRLDRKRSTHTRVLMVLRELGEFGVASTADLTPALLARWKEGPSMRARAPLTRKTLFSVVSTVADYAVGMGYLAVSPTAAWPFRFSSRRATRKRHHSAEDLARVLETLDRERKSTAPGSPARWRAERLYALFCVAAFTGARKMEILRLRVEDLDLDRGVISIVDRGGKTTGDYEDIRGLKTEASEAPIPMADFLVAAMAEWLPLAGPGWAFPNTTKPTPWIEGKRGAKPLDRLKAAGGRAGVEGLTFLSLRHSWATHAETLWGFSDALIQRVLRHTTPRTAREHYRHADVINLRAAVKSIGFPAAPRPQIGREIAPEIAPDFGAKVAPESRAISPPNPRAIYVQNRPQGGAHGA